MRTSRVLLYAILFSGSLVSTMNANPVLWSSHPDGMAHYYDIVGNTSLSWYDARVEAESAVFNGMKGYLVTITSSSENQFIWDMYLDADSNPQSMYYWIGGFRDSISSDWQWVTGEEWSFETWGSSEPSGDGDVLEIYSSLEYWNDDHGKWNDQPGTVVTTSRGYIVEYGPTVLSNTPPVAVCQQAVVAVEEVPNIDGGSYDPDGDAITISQNPPGAFNETGIYDVILTVTDPYGATDSCTAMVVVYDPSGGFVTGGGWIWSPAGAYADDSALEGKANFGFVSKYKKGANVPTGNTEFQFKAGSLNFHSSSYDWLVVNQGGTNAQFKGVGTINSTGEYKFMLWAGDDEIDTFRIKIWYEDGVEVVVYDNESDKPIGGGSIIIHKK